MKINFHGAAGTVTGSMHLIEVNQKRILLDCGFYQGKRQETYEKNLNLPFDPKSIDILVLSHAHIDHSGNIPNLVKNGFKGDIICTYATRDLCAIMLRDAAHIQEYDVMYINKKRAKENLPLVEPIYRSQDAVESLKFFLGMSYNRAREIAPGITLTFYDAGHILGSAMVALDILDQEDNKQKRLVFSGDIGRPNRPIIKDPEFIESADILIIESTYGDRVHEDVAEADDKLEKIINNTIKQGGKVIVPSFAVGRTQEIVYRLRELIQLGRISRNLPVYIDSPLAVDATGIYRLHPEAYDEEASRILLGLEGRNTDPFGFDMVHYTRTVEESKNLNKIEEPCIIISASGMAEAGRIQHHLKNNIEDSRNTVLFVGWQAPHTLGRRILEHQKEVNILNQALKVKANVAKINGFSAHADRDEMIAWVKGFRKKPDTTFVVHGEPLASQSFAKTLESNGLKKVSVPELHQSVRL
ncbi:MAG: MBL fold metallo-hydrolase [Spirochaetales bacterium]|nr:MBL fold metallo-hydrolase [Spirochaetales bacterium]